MATDPTIILAITGASLIGLVVASQAALRGWRDWIELQRTALERRARPDAGPPGPTQRIEIADLKERIRKLEAIAAGVDL